MNLLKLFKRKEVYVCPDWTPCKLTDIRTGKTINKNCPICAKEKPLKKGLTVRHGNISHSIYEPCKLCEQILRGEPF